jgi:hypothetical protein
LVPALAGIIGNPVKIRSYPRSCKVVELSMVNGELLTIHHSLLTILILNHFLFTKGKVINK